MINAGYQQYQRVQVQTAGPGELLLLLYNGCIKFLNRAKTAIAAHDILTAHNSLMRSQDILSELHRAVDLSSGPLAVNLSRLYDYMYWRLVEANVKKEIEPIDEVLGHLRELLEAWEEAVHASPGTLTRVQPSLPVPVRAPVPVPMPASAPPRIGTSMSGAYSIRR